MTAAKELDRARELFSRTRSRYGERYSATRLLCTVLAMLACSASKSAGHTLPHSSRFELQNLYTALAGTDTAVLTRQLGKDLVWTDGVSGKEYTRAQILQLVATRPSGSAPRTVIDSVHADTISNFIFASSTRTDHRTLGHVDFPSTWRALDVFAHRDGRWQLIRHTQTWLVTPVQPIADLDSTALLPFVGRYEVAPGYVDDVHMDGDHLVATLTGYPPGARLEPVSTTVFSPDGTGALIAFERDAKGRVIGYVQGYPDGRVMRRRKLP